MRRKKFLQSEQSQMIASQYVQQAREMAALLEDRETAAAGSRSIARKRLESISGVSASILHSLRYRPPKTIAADVFDRLCLAIERQAEKQIGILQHEILSARACRLGIDDCALGEAETALRQARGVLKGSRQ